MRRIRYDFFLSIALVLAACGQSESSVRLAVQYEEAWGLAELELAIEGDTASVGVSPELLIWTKDEWVNRDVTIEVTGLRDGERQAWGRVMVRPLAGSEISATVALSRLPCGAWCTPGAASCAGDNVVVCEEQADGCFRWSERVPCRAATPYCSLGECRTECIDECAEGESRCAGPTGVEQCGRTPSSTCLRWLPVMACANGEICSGGQCARECRDECQAGDLWCRDGGISHCADRDRNGCTEWGPTEPCGSGESCQAGSCRPNELCTDECAENTCNGSTFSRCGNFDGDPCLEPSPGVSCVPSDDCLEGQCTLSGCRQVAKVCDQPPARACVDSDTLRVYDPAGTCSRGACEYAPRDIACANCPNCDACAGVTCNRPPNGCFMPTGTCDGGVCSYAPANGANCDDGNACTDGDTCEEGICAGTLTACNTAPAPTCVDSSTLRTFMTPGTCSGAGCNYPHADMSCAAGCEAGACRRVGCGPSEVCGDSSGNGLDDNCDGQVDEGCSCTRGEIRPCFAGPPERRDIGACADGVEYCNEFGIWGTCQGGVSPGPEVCNGSDDDCNGDVDDLSECRSSITCPSHENVRPLAAHVLVGDRVYTGAARSWTWDLECPATVPAELCPRLMTPNAENTEVYFAASGAYRVRVTVVLEDGTTANCGWTVYVRGDGLRVELNWNTMADGADLDLHLHRWTRNGVDTEFFTAGDDCFFGTCTPGRAYSWSNHASSALENCEDAPHGGGAIWQSMGGCRNPRMDVDINGTNGPCNITQRDPNASNFCAPENINVDRPVIGLPYRIMVNYFASNGVAGTQPRVNIYCGGALRAVFGEEPLVFLNNGADGGARNDNWHVADVVFFEGRTGLDCTIYPIGTIVRGNSSSVPFGPSWSCTYNASAGACTP